MQIQGLIGDLTLRHGMLTVEDGDKADLFFGRRLTQIDEDRGEIDEHVKRKGEIMDRRSRNCHRSRGTLVTGELFDVSFQPSLEFEPGLLCTGRGGSMYQWQLRIRRRC